MIKKLLTTLILTFSASFSFAQFVTPDKLGMQEGVDYIEVKPGANSVLKDVQTKPVLIDFFWYGCPHCFRMKPLIDRIATNYGDKIVFQHYPVLFPRWEQGAKVFFALEENNLVGKYHDAIFNEIHVKGVQLHANPIAFTAFMERNKEDIKKINGSMNSFGMSAKLNKARKVVEAYKIESSPNFAVVLGDRTFLIDPSKLNSYERTAQNINKILAANTK